MINLNAEVIEKFLTELHVFMTAKCIKPLNLLETLRGSLSDRNAKLWL